MKVGTIALIVYVVITLLVGVYTFIIVNVEDTDFGGLETQVPTAQPLPAFVIVVISVVVLFIIQRRYNKNGTTRGERKNT